MITAPDTDSGIELEPEVHDSSFRLEPTGAQQLRAIRYAGFAAPWSLSTLRYASVDEGDETKADQQQERLH